MLSRTERILENIPVGTVGLIPVTGCEELVKKVDDYLVKWRKESAYKYKDDAAFIGYSKDSFIVDAKIPRFGSGEAKGIISESVRGKDLYILLDVCNYSVTYSFLLYTSPSPRDRSQTRKPS